MTEPSAHQKGPSAMPASQAHIPTDRASRYLAQLCNHTGQMAHRNLHRIRRHGEGAAPPEVRHTESSDTDGVIEFGQGRCTLRATGEALILHAQAEDQQQLQRIQDGITRRLERIGRRDRLAVVWTRLSPTTGPDDPAE